MGGGKVSLEDTKPHLKRLITKITKKNLEDGLGQQPEKDILQTLCSFYFKGRSNQDSMHNLSRGYGVQR